MTATTLSPATAIIIQTTGYKAVASAPDFIQNNVQAETNKQVAKLTEEFAKFLTILALT